MDPEADRIEIGAVTSVNPARRELRVALSPLFDHQLDGVRWVRLMPRTGHELRCRVTSVRGLADDKVVTLGAGVLRETVAGLKGAAVVVCPEELKPRPDGDEPRWVETIDFTVVTAQGAPLGRVTDVIPTPGHDVLEIERVGGGAVLVPAVEEAVAEVDWEGRRVVVHDLAPYGVEHAD